jgi:hypothetical protein
MLHSSQQEEMIAMMGMQQSPQSSLFYIGINIDKRVRYNHPLRRVKRQRLGASACGTKTNALAHLL